jgi:hypothetical protein
VKTLIQTGLADQIARFTLNCHALDVGLLFTRGLGLKLAEALKGIPGGDRDARRSWLGAA